MDGAPLVKWFSPTDQSQGGPFGVTCVRIDKPVNVSWRTWLSWGKLLQLLEGTP